MLEESTKRISLNNKGGIRFDIFGCKGGRGWFCFSNTEEIAFIEHKIITKKFINILDRVSKVTHIITLAKNMIHDYCSGEISIDTIESAIVVLADYTKVGKALLIGWTIGTWLEPLFDIYLNNPHNIEQSFSSNPYERSRAYEPGYGKF